MVFICIVCLFNSIPFHCADVADHAIIDCRGDLGVAADSGMPFGFMALLGVLSLGGELIKMQIVVLSKIRVAIQKGAAPYPAIIDGCTSKMRPVCMVVITTVLGMSPAFGGSILRRYGGVPHVRFGVRRVPLLDCDAGALLDVLQWIRTD